MEPGSRALPELTKVTGITVKDGLVSWTADETKNEISVHQVAFVVQGTNGQGTQDFVVCTLVEKAEDKDAPFEARFLLADSIPPPLQKYVLEKAPAHLRHGARNEVDVVVSVKSGTGKSLKFWHEVLGPAWALVAERITNSDGDDPEAARLALPRVLVTENEDSVRSFARSLWAAQESGENTTRTVVLLSGDGGVVDLLNGCEELESRHPPRVSVALLPLGTGNALFNSTHKPLYEEPGPSPLVVGLRALFTGAPADLPVFRASFSEGSRIVTFADEDKAKAKANDGDGNDGKELHLTRQEKAVTHLYGAIVASYGFHASIVYESDTPEYRAHGDKRFGMVANELLRESHPYRAAVSYSALPLDSAADNNGQDKDLETVVDRESHAYVLTTLVSNLERTFTISPAGRPLDGHLRLVHFGPVGGERTLDVMMKAYDGGKHVGTRWDDIDQGVGYEAVGAVRVVARDEDARWRKVCVDGTIVELPLGGKVTVSTLKDSPCRLVVDPGVLGK